MGFNDHADYKLSNALEGMINDGLLQQGTIAFEITRLVIGGGLGALSDKQRRVYDAYIEPQLRRRTPS
jgi:hypothetical protein